MKRSPLLFVLLPAVLVFYACNGGTGGGGSTVTPVDVRVGAVVSLSGEFGVYGNAIKRGIEIALNDLNVVGVDGVKGVGGQNFSIEIMDSASTKAGARSAFNKLAGSGAKIVIGPDISLLAEELIPLSNSNKVILISPSSSSPGLRNLDSDGYFFRICPTDNKEAEMIVTDMQRKPLSKGGVTYAFTKTVFDRALVIVHKDDPYCQGLLSAFARMVRNFEGLPFETLYFDAAALNGEENQAELAKLVEAGRNYVLGKKMDDREGCVVVFAFDEETKKTLTAFKEADLKLQVYVSSAVDTSTFFINGIEALEGIIWPRVFDPKADIPQVKDFVGKYHAKYHEEPDLYAAYGYDAAMIIGLTLRQPNINEQVKDPLNFRLRMNDVDYRGLTGAINFSQKDLEVAKNFNLYCLVDGSPMTVTDYREKLLADKFKELEKQAGR